MAEPTKKSDAIENVLDVFMLGMRGGLAGCTRRESIQADRCALCNGRAVKFDNALSQREFTISGACQLCQDVLFAPDEPQRHPSAPASPYDYERDE